MARSQHIGLIMHHSLGFYRDVLLGIQEFARTRPHWVFIPLAPDPRVFNTARARACAGFIGHVFGRKMARRVIRLKRPLVNVSGVLPDLPVARVAIDHAASGELAAAHFLERGFRRFAFVGYPRHEFSRGREQGFTERLARAGYEARVFHESHGLTDDPLGFESASPGLSPWLRRLPKPVAIFCSHDLQAFQLSELCRDHGLRIPEEVALLGVDNDSLLSELTQPSLSSVLLPTRRIGFEAAALLDAMLAGKTRQPRTVLLSPVGVVTRQSSDFLAVEDASLARAGRFIRENFQRRIGVEEVWKQAGLSRRALERKFRDQLGRGIAQEIRHCRLQRARELLLDTDWPVNQIAEASGFAEAKLLSVAFRKQHGLPPAEYRKRERPPAGRPAGAARLAQKEKKYSQERIS